MNWRILILIISFYFSSYAGDTHLYHQYPVPLKLVIINFTGNGVPSNEEMTSLKYTPMNVIGQAAAGAASAVIISRPLSTGLSFGGGNSNSSSEDWKIAGAYSLFILGTAVGVDLIGSMENESLTFWKVLAASAVGGAAGFATYSIVKDEFYFPLLAGPLIGAMVYTLFIAD